MAKDAIATPMLDEFLRQAEAPGAGPIPEWIDWPLAVAIFVGMSWLGHRFVNVGFLLAVVVFIAIRQVRKVHRQRLSRADRAACERWEKVERLQHLQHDNRLRKRTPEPVLLALERAARAWHDAHIGIAALAQTDSVFAGELDAALTASMVAAAAAADPVVLRDEQSKKVLQRIEGDEDLITRISHLIAVEEARMRQWALGIGTADAESPDTIRARLAAARREREVAEAELDALL